MKYSNSDIEDYKKLRQSYSQMSWFILECDIVYYSKSDFPNSIKIHNSWVELRSIPDELYDQRKLNLRHLAEALDENYFESSMDESRSSVKIALARMRKKARNSVCWPTNTEQLQIFILILGKFSKKYLSGIKEFYDKVQGF